MAESVVAREVGTVRATRKESKLPTQITLGDEQRAVNALADFFSSEVQPRMRDLRSCVMAARLATKSLDRIGIPNQFSHVDATCLNDEWLHHAQLGTPAEEVPLTAWSISVWSNHDLVFRPSGNYDPNGFSGHLIVETENFMIDLSAQQFDRPQHEIITGGPLVVPLSDLTEVRQGFVLNETWSVPIELGHYWFNDAVLPTRPSNSNDWRYGYRDFLPDCVKAMRRAMYSEPLTVG